MKKMRILFIFVLFTIVLGACGNKVDVKRNLTDEQKQSYTQMAQDTIKLLNEEKFKEISEKCNDELKIALTEEQFKTITDKIKSNGDFVEFSESDVTTIKENGKMFFVVVQSAKYSKSKFLYKISFDENNKLAGIFYK